MKISTFHLLALAAGLTASSAFALPTEPRSVTCEQLSQTMTTEVLDVFQDKEKSDDEKQVALMTLFKRDVDTDWIGKFVTGAGWKKATKAEQKDYLEAYRDYISAVYISKFNDDNGYKVSDIELSKITPLDKGIFNAQTTIRQEGEPDVNVAFRLDESKGSCQVKDITVEGVSLLNAQRQEFKPMAEKDGVAALTSTLRDRLKDL